jgi:hypothetical protein
MNETIAGAPRGAAPWHLWAVGLISLLWNCFGGYDYTMSHLGGLEYFQAMGFDEEVFAWFKAMPAWATAAWAIGVWVSLLGAILLLARSRHAATAFLVSLVGAAVSFAYQFTSARPASLEGIGNTVVPVVILIAIVLQWYYARRMAAAGVLR